MKYRTAYSEQVRKPSPNGSKWRKKYVRDVALDGVRSLKEAPPENQYELVQAARFGLTPRECLQRFAAGDTSALSEVDLKAYQDLTNVPSSLSEALKVSARAQELFSSLPKEVKVDYGNDISKLVSAIDDGSFFKTYMNKPKEQTSEDLKSEIEALKKIINKETVNNG